MLGGGGLTSRVAAGVLPATVPEPTLQPETSETFEGASTNKQDGARLDVVVDGFWGGTLKERT